MSRLSFRVENQWRYLADGCDIDLFRVLAGLNCWRGGIGVYVLGFGVALTFWRMTIPASAIPKPRAREPIEHDGWAGEPRGMEKAS